MRIQRLANHFFNDLCALDHSPRVEALLEPRSHRRTLSSNPDSKIKPDPDCESASLASDEESSESKSSSDFFASDEESSESKSSSELPPPIPSDSRDKVSSELVSPASSVSLSRILRLAAFALVFTPVLTLAPVPKSAPAVDLFRKDGRKTDALFGILRRPCWYLAEGKDALVK